MSVWNQGGAGLKQNPCLHFIQGVSPDAIENSLIHSKSIFTAYFESDDAATMELISDRSLFSSYATEQEEAPVKMGWVLLTNPRLSNNMIFKGSVENAISVIAAKFERAPSAGLKVAPQDVGIEVEEPRIGA